MRQDFASLGDRLKDIESRNKDYLTYMLPVYARLDGKKFSQFTKGMKKPFDEAMVNAMQATASRVLSETNADLAYVQSDEISLFWFNNVSCQEEMSFAGRLDKTVGELSGLSTAVFNQEIAKSFPDRLSMLPRFDTRVFNVDRDIAAKFFLWRQMDCIKNSISVISSSFFSHRELQGVSTRQRLAMLDRVSPWDDYSVDLRYGAFFRKVAITVDPESLQLPDHVKKPTEPVSRSVIKRIVYSPLQQFDELTDLLHYNSCKQYIELEDANNALF